MRLTFIAGIFTAFLTLPALAQTTRAPTAPGIGLTADHKRTIYRDLGAAKAQSIPEGNAAIGSEIPDSLTLNEMPVSLKDQIGLLRDFKFARLADEKILIVDPAKRQVVDIVTKDEGTR